MKIAYQNVFYIKLIFQDNSSYEIDNAISAKRVIKNNFDFTTQWEIECSPLLESELVEKLSNNQVKEVLITFDVKHENGAIGDYESSISMPEIELVSVVKSCDSCASHKLILRKRCI